MIEFFNLVTYLRHLRIHMFDLIYTSTLSHNLWGMTRESNVYVSMSWVKLNDLLDGHFGILHIIKKYILIIDKLFTK
jgi:hypothetical protein